MVMGERLESKTPLLGPGVADRDQQEFLPLAKTDFVNTYSPVLRQTPQGDTPMLLWCDLANFLGAGGE